MTPNVSEAGRDRIEKWNARYSRREALHGFEPSPPLPLIANLAPRGRALDLACGAGRHAIYLAGLGWTVDAVDASRVGLDVMAETAAERNVASRITAIEADLESPECVFVIAPEAYDLVCDFYFLERSLFPAIREGVRPGGYLVAAIHVADPLAGAGAPHGFLLERGELRRLVESWGWTVVHATVGETGEDGHSHATDTIIARRPLS